MNKAKSSQHIGVACSAGHTSSSDKDEGICDRVTGYSYHCEKCGVDEETEKKHGMKYCPNCGTKYLKKARKPITCGKQLQLEFD